MCACELFKVSTEEVESAPDSDVCHSLLANVSAQRLRRHVQVGRSCGQSQHVRFRSNGGGGGDETPRRNVAEEGRMLHSSHQRECWPRHHYLAAPVGAHESMIYLDSTTHCAGGA